MRWWTWTTIQSHNSGCLLVVCRVTVLVLNAQQRSQRTSPRPDARTCLVHLDWVPPSWRRSFAPTEYDGRNCATPASSSRLGWCRRRRNLDCARLVAVDRRQHKPATSGFSQRRHDQSKQRFAHPARRSSSRRPDRWMFGAASVGRRRRTGRRRRLKNNTRVRPTCTNAIYRWWIHLSVKVY